MTVAIAPVTDATRSEAQMLDLEVRLNEFQLRISLYRFHSRRAWVALEYTNFEAYCTDTLTMSYSQALRYVNAGDVAQHEPSGLFDRIGIKHAEQLGKLPAPDRPQAWALARRIADKVGHDTPTVNDVRQAVSRMEAEKRIEATAPPVVVERLHAGKLTVTDATALTDAFNRLPPHGKSVAAQMIDRHDIRNGDVLTAVGELGARKNRDESKVWQEINDAGTVNGVLLSEATGTDVEQARRAAQREHLEEADAQALDRNDLVARIVTVYDGRNVDAAAGRTAAALRRELSEPVLNAMKEML